MKRILVLAGLGMVASIVGCSYPNKSTDMVSRSEATKTMVKGGRYAVVNFRKGTSELTDSDKSTLRKLAVMAESNEKQVEEIRVLAWADREYPGQATEASKVDVDLANARADRIADYIGRDIKFNGDIDKHNMARRPNAVSKLFKTDDYDIKSVFENTGAVPVENSKNVLSTNKASQAVVYIEFE